MTSDSPEGTARPPGPPQPAHALRPLTRRYLRGPKKGLLYARRPEVEREIEELVLLSPGDLVARIARVGYGQLRFSDRRRPEGYIGPEALVYLVRHHASQVDRHLAEGRRAEALAHRRAAEHAWAAVVAVATSIIQPRLRGLAGPDRAEAEADVVVDLNGRLPKTDASGEYLEISFGDEVDKKTVNAYNRQRRRRQLVPVVLPPDTSLEEVAIDPSLRPDDLLLKAEALDRLPDKHREPYVLHVLQGFPITSKDPSAESVTAKLGVSNKTVTDRIRKAESELRRRFGGGPAGLPNAPDDDDQA